MAKNFALASASATVSASACATVSWNGIFAPASAGATVFPQVLLQE